VGPCSVAHDKAAPLTRMEMHVLVGHVARQLPDPISPRSEARREPKKAALSTARDKRIGSQDFSYPSPVGAVFDRAPWRPQMLRHAVATITEQATRSGRQNVSLFLAKKRLTPLLGCSKLNIIPWHPAFDCKIARCADLSSQVKMTIKAVNIIAGLLIGFLADGPSCGIGAKNGPSDCS
jgi:hypothetical protein